MQIEQTQPYLFSKKFNQFTNCPFYICIARQNTRESRKNSICTSDLSKAPFYYYYEITIELVPKIGVHPPIRKIQSDETFDTFVPLSFGERTLNKCKP